MVITITIPPERENDKRFIRRILQNEYNKISHKAHNPSDKSPLDFTLQKRSLDARHGTQKLHLRYEVSNDRPKSFSTTKDSFAPHVVSELFHIDASEKRLKSLTDSRPIIVGCGPSGIFCALTLLSSGVRPIILDCGCDVSKRKIDIASLLKSGVVNPYSNFSFGAGGAGAFSDGKLFTRSTKRGDLTPILYALVNFGASEKILTANHAHIGSNLLPSIVENIITYLRNGGTEVFFNTKVTDIIIESGRVTALSLFDTKTNEARTLPAETVILSCGSADISLFCKIAAANPNALEEKGFAYGVRVEHPRALIDSIQFHTDSPRATGSEYFLTTQVDGSGVYSFCMCPGGVVVPSQSAPRSIVVNGMSASARAGRFSNAALVVETSPKDIPPRFKEKAADLGCPPLAGLFFRQSLEEEAFQRANGDAAPLTKVRAPAQRVTDFLTKDLFPTLPASSYAPGLTPSRLCVWMPDFFVRRLTKALTIFDKKMHGFISEDALLIGVETRTSSPVRLLRDKFTRESPIKGLFPAGEGSGYAGGITTSALDGVLTAKSLLKE